MNSSQTDPATLNRVKLRKKFLLHAEREGWEAAKVLHNDDYQALINSPLLEDDSDAIMQAQRASIPQPGQDTSGLYDGATMDEYSAIWKKCGNSFDPAKCEIGYGILCDSYAHRFSLSAADAEQRVRTDFKSLSSLRDSYDAARKLGVSLPAVQAGVGTQVLSMPASTPGYSSPTKPMPASALQRLANPFPCNPRLDPAIANTLSDDGVIDTYCTALNAHMKSHRDCSPFKAHQAILALHVPLAKALRKQFAAKPDTDNAQEADADAVANDNPHPLAPKSAAERLFWEKAIEGCKVQAARGSKFYASCIPAIKKLLGQPSS